MRKAKIKNLFENKYLQARSKTTQRANEKSLVGIENALFELIRITT